MTVAKLKDGVSDKSDCATPEQSLQAVSAVKGGIANAEKPWTVEAAVELCREAERVAPDYGAHIGLTGGLLYKHGPRKDCDIIVYRIRQVERIDHEGLFAAFSEHIGLTKKSGFGWCHKCEWRGMPVDVFFPEEAGEYEEFDEVTHRIEMGEFA